MSLRKKLFKQVKTIFGSKSSDVERPPENETSPDVSIAPGQPPGVHTNRPDSLGEGSGRGIRTTKDESIGRGDDNTAPIATRSNGERMRPNAENRIADNKLRVPEFVYPNTNRQDSSDQQDIDGIEKVQRVQGTNPSTFDNRNRRAAAGNDKDRELLGLSGQPPMSHAPSSELMRFDGVTNSGISMGGGTVNVSNTFHNNPSERIRPGLELLQKRVATSAFHNSAHRVDPPRCHPDTRVAIQKQIYDWIVLNLVTRQAWIMWIHGAAGGGKSAIMQSVAEFCEKAQIPLASFFFFRTDSTRNTMAHFIATLVYQLVQKIPQAQNEIFTSIESNPLVFDESLESQLQKLVIQPLLRVREYFKGFFVIFIDGLDECIDRAHQVDLIKLLGTISRSMKIPVIFLIASRREPQIEAAFIDEPVCKLLLTLPLDNSDIEQTSDDIQHFLTDKFANIKKTHLRKHLLSTDWPPRLAVEEIITTSSGQFIYASVVINYVSSPRGNPAYLLDVVRGIRLRDPSSQNPFAHLDALYQYIFSQVEALDKVLDILAFILILPHHNSSDIEYTFRLGDGELEVCFTDMAAVINSSMSRYNSIKFLHASLPDFLRDKTRSERYHIDFEKYIPKLLCMFLSMVPQSLDPLLQAYDFEIRTNQEYYRIWAIRDLITEGVRPSDQLQRSFMTFSITFHKKNFDSLFWVENLIEILAHLKQLNFNDKGQAYRHVLDVIAAGFARFWTLLRITDRSEVKKIPDLLARISEIHQDFWFYS